jgi:hypothetical protein
MCITHLDGSPRSRSRGRGRSRSSSSSSSSCPGMHGSAQRLKQGLELERCAPGQSQIVDIPARTLQTKCSRSPARALPPAHPSTRTHPLNVSASRERGGENESARAKERDGESEREREREKERERERERESERASEREKVRERASERERREIERERQRVRDSLSLFHCVCPSQ